MDVSISLLLLGLLSPIFIWLYIRVKASSEGPVIFKQERLGRWSNPFVIYKFRSMYVDSEQSGPALAQVNDERCTPFGLWMRRWRFDELPQLYNVLIGDMSLVGPRPERAHYADKLTKAYPKYALVWTVRPGITSWGQIKFGYAADIQSMITRSRYDLLYVHRASILMDIRILIDTIRVLLSGSGR